jgi:hypothetical protein
LREVVSGFWEEGGGGLELSIDASDEVLACLCRYIHTSALYLPIRLSRQLELLRVASELGMASLYQCATGALLQKLTLDSVPKVIAFCTAFGFADLERSCRLFLNSGGKRSTVIRYQSAGELNPQNAYLRDAIFSSLQDVNAVLSQQPAVAPGASATGVPATSAGSASSRSQSFSLHQQQQQQLQQAFPSAASLRAPHTGERHVLAPAPAPAPSFQSASSFAHQPPSEFSLEEYDPSAARLDRFDRVSAAAAGGPGSYGGDGGAHAVETSMSLLDIAAGGYSFERSFNSGHSDSSFNRSPVSLSKHVPSSFFLDAPETKNVMQAGAQQQQPQQHQHQQRGGKAGKNSTGSGGIYKLLLKAGSGDLEEEEGCRNDYTSTALSHAPARSMTMNRGGGGLKTPARTMQPSKGSSRSSLGSRQPRPQGPAQEQQPTPRTMRASSLLGAARPSAYVDLDALGMGMDTGNADVADDCDAYADGGDEGYGEDYDASFADEEQSEAVEYVRPLGQHRPQQQQLQSANKAGARVGAGRKPAASNNSRGGGGGGGGGAAGGPQEYAKDMSLAPPREPTQHEKKYGVDFNDMFA